MVIVAVPGPFAFITPCWSTETTAGLPEEYRSVSPDDALAPSDLVPPVSGNVNADIEDMLCPDSFFSLTLFCAAGTGFCTTGLGVDGEEEATEADVLRVLRVLCVVLFVLSYSHFP